MTQKYGKLTLIEITQEKSKNGKRLARFNCDCGNECWKEWCRVNKGKINSCGCGKTESLKKFQTTQQQEINSLIGQKFNRLTLISIRTTENNITLGLFKCDCGNECIKNLCRVRRGDIKSCNCLHDESCSRNGKKHSIHNMTNTPEFRAWRSIKDYCENINNARYQFIGARGIQVCTEWQKEFLNFYNDVGPRPTNRHRLIRFDINKDFCKDNCGWSTSPNRIISYDEMSGQNSTNWDGFGEISKTFWNTVENRSIKSRRNKIIELSITIEYAWNIFLQQDRKCAFTGLELKFGKKNKDITASLDRIDSSKGYIEGNVQWVHKKVNIMKNQMSDKEFIEWCNLISNYRSV